MSNKNQQRNGGAQQKPAATQDAAQQDQQQQQQGQGNESQDQSQQDVGGDQQQQDNAAGDQQSKDNAGAAPAADVKEEPAQDLKVEKTADPVPQTQKQGFTPVLKIQLDLTNYAEAMDKKKSIVPEDGGKWQYSLYSTLKSTLNAKDQETFNAEWNTALAFFNQNKDGIFNENFLFRFPEQWPGSATEFTSFRRIVYMMIQTANVKTRKAGLKDINMGLVVEGLNEAQRTKLLNFYEV